MPAFPAAYEHVQKYTGDWRLAAQDIWEHLVAGDIAAQDCFVILGKRIEVTPLKAEIFKTAIPRADAHSFWFSGFFPIHGHIILLNRADVYRIWPPFESAPQRLKPLPPTKPKGLGNKTWPAVQVMYALKRECFMWTTDNVLFEKVCKEFPVKERPSPRSLETAVEWLRNNDYF
jgi:hypothetical protein